MNNRKYETNKFNLHIFYWKSYIGDAYNEPSIGHLSFQTSNLNTKNYFSVWPLVLSTSGNLKKLFLSPSLLYDVTAENRAPCAEFSFRLDILQYNRINKYTNELKMQIKNNKLCYLFLDAQDHTIKTARNITQHALTGGIFSNTSTERKLNAQNVRKYKSVVRPDTHINCITSLIFPLRTIGSVFPEEHVDKLISSTDSFSNYIRDHLFVEKKNIRAIRY